MDLEGGKFSVTIKSDELHKLNTNIKALGVLVFMGAIASGLITGAFELAARQPVQANGGTSWPLAAVGGLALAAMLFGAAVAWTLVSGRMKKLSLRKWLR